MCFFKGKGKRAKMSVRDKIYERRKSWKKRTSVMIEKRKEK